jgi:cell division protein FtsA
VVALGGQQITNDIAIGLRTPPDQAEKIKLNWGMVSSENVNPNETLSVPGVGGRPARTIYRNVLVDIITPRVEEILTLVYQKIQDSDMIDLMAAGAVITGGGALLSRITELAENLWGMPVKLGVPKYLGGLTDTVRSPIYSTAVGLCLYGSRYHDGESYFSRRNGNLWEEVLDGFKRFFRRFF